MRASVTDVPSPCVWTLALTSRSMSPLQAPRRRGLLAAVGSSCVASSRPGRFRSNEYGPRSTSASRAGQAPDRRRPLWDSEAAWTSASMSVRASRAWRMRGPLTALGVLGLCALALGHVSHARSSPVCWLPPWEPRRRVCTPDNAHEEGPASGERGPLVSFSVGRARMPAVSPRWRLRARRRTNRQGSRAPWPCGSSRRRT